MAADPGRNVDDHIQQILTDYLASLETDEPLTEEALLEQHPQIAVRLRLEFAKLRRVIAAQMIADTNETLNPDSRRPISGLEVRCPHCHAPTRTSLDESFHAMVCGACGDTFSLIRETVDDFSVGSMLGRFILVERIGSGGFGSVWKARDTQLDRCVALKMPRQSRGGSDREQILREARAAASLNHPNIVRVHEVGLEAETVFIASDLIDGDALSERLRKGGFTIRETVAMCQAIARGLHHAHCAGVVHRDLKPQNVLVGKEQTPYLTDFGLARRESTDVTMTIEGQILGTPAYMSPEQAMGESHSADCRSDVYSFGVLLFEMLTGDVPFRGSPQVLINRVINDDAPRPRKLNQQIPVDLETICLKCLEKEPERRYASALDLAEDLTRVAENKPILARPVSPLARASRWVQRNPILTTLGTGVVVTTLAGLLMLVFFLSELAVSSANEFNAKLFQIRELHTTRPEGFQEDVRELVASMRDYAQAHDRVREVQHEVIAGLGQSDFVGYSGLTISFENATTANINPAGTHAAVGLSNGEIAVYDIRRASNADSDEATRVAHVHPHSRPVLAVFLSGDEPWQIVSIDETGNSVTSIGKGNQWEQVTSLEGQRSVSSARFSYDGKFLAVNGDRDIVLYETSDWEPIHACQLPADLPTVRGSAASPDGRFLAACYDDAQSDSGFCIWEVGTDRHQLKRINRGGAYAGGISFSSDGQFLIFGCEQTIIYRMPELKHLASVQTEEISAVAMSPRSKYTAAGNIRGEIRVRNTRSQVEIARFKHSRGSRAKRIAFRDDLLYSLSDEALRVWRFNVRDELIKLVGHDQGVPSLVFTTDGELLSGSKDESVRFWKAADGAPADRHIQCDHRVQTLAITPDREHVMIAFEGTDVIELWRLDDRVMIDSFPTALKRVMHMTFSPDGNFIATCGDGMRLWRYRFEDNRLSLSPVEAPSDLNMPWCVHACFSSSSQQLYWASIAPPKTLHSWDLGNGNKYSPMDTAIGSGWHGIEYLEDSRELAFVGGDGRLHVRSATGSSKRYLGNQYQFETSHIAVHPNRRWVATLVQANQIAIWDLKTAEQLFAFRPEATPVWSMRWSPTGHRLAVGLSGGGVSMWDFEKILTLLSELGIPIADAPVHSKPRANQ